MCPCFNAMLVFHQVFQHDFHFCLNVMAGLITQIKEMLVVRVVVVLFKLHPWIFYIPHLNFEPECIGNFPDFEDS